MSRIIAAIAGIGVLSAALTCGAEAPTEDRHRDRQQDALPHGGGDWQVKPNGSHVIVVKMSDRRYEFVVGMHEPIEAYLALHAGVSQAAVDRCDGADKAKRKSGDNSEPGDDPHPPYHKAHVFGSKTSA